METWRKLVDVPGFTGADGAHIQELVGRGMGLASQSVALITHPAGTASVAHHHTVVDEVYFVQSGQAALRVDDDTRTVGPGDIVILRPGQTHKLWNAGPADLVLLAICAPAYDVAEVVWDE